jgi:hypothetical protein
MSASLRAHRSWPVLMLLALTLVHGLIYVSIIPPWQAPDEPYHFLSAQSAILLNAPDAQSRWEGLKRDIGSSMMQFRFSELDIFVPAVSAWDDLKPYLWPEFEAPAPFAPRTFAYYLLALPLRLVQGLPITLQLYWARLFSVLVNAGVVALAFGVGRLLFENDRFGSLLLPLAIIFLPQHTFVMAAVSDGNPAELFVSAAVYVWVRGMVRGFRWYLAGLIGIFIALGIATKPTAFFVVPVLVIWCAIYLWKKMPGWWKALVPGVAAALIAGLFNISERVRYFSLVVLGRILDETGQGRGVMAWQFHRLPPAVFETFRSFWGSLGWASLPIGDAWAFVLLALVLAALAGLVRFARRYGRDRHEVDAGCTRALGQALPVFGAFIVVGCAMMLVMFGYSSYRYGLYEGRYLFPAIIPIMAVLVTGWREWVPVTWRSEALVGIATFFFLFDAVVWLDYAIPFFYPVWR